MKLSEAKHFAHESFDRLWKTGRMSRDKAYDWLARVLEIPREDAHIRRLSVDECIRVVIYANAALKAIPKPRRRA